MNAADEAALAAERRWPLTGLEALAAAQKPSLQLRREAYVEGYLEAASREAKGANEPVQVTDAMLSAAVRHLKEYYEVRSSHGNLRWIVPDEEVRAALEAAWAITQPSTEAEFEAVMAAFSALDDDPVYLELPGDESIRYVVKTFLEAIHHPSQPVPTLKHSLEEAKAVVRVVYGPNDPAGWEVKKAFKALEAADEVRTSKPVHVPETVTTAEELDALPNDAVILDSMGDVGVVHGEYVWYPESNPIRRSKVAAHYLPARVVYRPTAPGEGS